MPVNPSTQLNSPARSFLSRFRRNDSGVAAIEMAFIFPVMLVLYFGLVDLTNLLSANRRVTLTSSTIADLVTQASASVTQNELDGYFNAASPIMDPFDSSAIGLEIFSYQVNTSSGDSELGWQYAKSGTTCGSAPGITSDMEDLMASGNGLVLARVCYQWQPITGKVAGVGAMQIEDQMILRPRQSNIIDCTDCP